MPRERHDDGPAHMPSRWRGAALTISSTRRIISAASVALRSTCCFTCAHGGGGRRSRDSQVSERMWGGTCVLGTNECSQEPRNEGTRPSRRALRSGSRAILPPKSASRASSGSNECNQSAVCSARRIPPPYLERLGDARHPHVADGARQHVDAHGAAVVDGVRGPQLAH